MSDVHVRSERRTQLIDITDVVHEAVAGRDGSAVLLFVPHTTAGLLVQAHGEDAVHVAADIELALERLVGEDPDYRHLAEGDRNPWAHIRAALTASSLTIPLVEHRLALSELQSIFFCEFDGPRERRVVVTVV
jgi:secondary thiamine-phosphate synthase enzyme